MIIRFAGDSGDGMQLTGDRFTSETAPSSATTSRRSRTSRPRSARRPARCPASPGFQVHFADHDILTPGDQPDVLVAMNPAALKTNLGDLPKGGTLIVNTDAFNERNLQKAGYATNPLDGRLARRLPRARGRAHVDDGRGAEGHRRDHVARGRALEELLRARPDVVALPAGRSRGRSRSSSRSSRSGPRSSRRTRGRFKAGYNYGETSEDFAVSYEVAPAPARARARTGRSPATRRPRYGLLAASQARPACPLFLGAYPITPASDDPRGAVAATRTSASRRSRPRTRSRPSARPSARRSAARSAVTTSAGPGHRRSRRRRSVSRSMVELPLVDRRRPARRPVDRHADEDRAGRPAAGDVRPERRVAGADRRRRRRPASASTLAIEACAHRAQVHDPGRLPLGRVPRERLGAVADPGRRRPARHRRGSRTRPTAATASTRTSATPRRSPGRGRSRARPASSTGSAASRRRTSPATSATTRTTTTGCSAARGEGRRDRGRHPGARGLRSRRRASSLILGWGSTYGAIGAAARAASQSGGIRSRTPTSATSTRSRRNTRRRPAALRRRCSSRRSTSASCAC